MRGKAMAAKNSRRHGLSLPASSDPKLLKQIEAHARDIYPGSSNERLYQLARSVAEANVDLVRIRSTRYDLLSGNVANEDLESPSHSRSQAPMSLVETTNLIDLLTQLERLDRYERRAISRRKFAIRAFDCVCQRKN